jgi:hypothetical protein
MIYKSNLHLSTADLSHCELQILSSEIWQWQYFQVAVFWVVILCAVTVGYPHFGGPCCFMLKMEASRSSTTLWYTTTILHGITTHENLKSHVSNDSDLWGQLKHCPSSLWHVISLGYGWDRQAPDITGRSTHDIWLRKKN